MTENNTTQWFRDPDKYTAWCLDLRRLLITADDVLAAARDVGSDGQAGAVVDLRGEPKDIAAAMEVAATGLRTIADALDQAATSGIAEGTVRRILDAPEQPQ